MCIKPWEIGLYQQEAAGLITNAESEAEKRKSSTKIVIECNNDEGIHMKSKSWNTYVRNGYFKKQVVFWWSLRDKVLKE